MNRKFPVRYPKKRNDKKKENECYYKNDPDQQWRFKTDKVETKDIDNAKKNCAPCNDLITFFVYGHAIKLNNKYSEMVSGEWEVVSGLLHKKINIQPHKRSCE